MLEFIRIFHQSLSLTAFFRLKIMTKKIIQTLTTNYPTKSHLLPVNIQNYARHYGFLFAQLLLSISWSQVRRLNRSLHDKGVITVYVQLLIKRKINGGHFTA